MSERGAKTIVLVTGAFLMAAIAIKRDTIQDPFRFAWAAGLTTLGLSLLADLAPEIAGPAAVLVLIAAYSRNKGVIGSVLPKTTDTAGSSTSTTTRSSTTKTTRPTGWGWNTATGTASTPKG